MAKPKDRGDSGVPSPCVNVCALDPAGRVCVGCFRTIDEIRRWPDAGDAERRAIRAAASARSHGFAPAPRAGPSS